MEVVWTILSILVICLILFFYATTRKFNYWKKKKIPFPKPLPFFGNYKQYLLLREYTSDITQKICWQFKDEPLIGTFFGTEPALIIQDPDIIKQVLTVDYYYFSSRELMDYVDREVMTRNIFFAYGHQWKVIRQGLTPLFSSVKMKSMFPLIKNCAQNFEDMLEYETGLTKVFDTKSLMTRYTMDCICSCAFGIDAKTLDKNSLNNPFLTMGNLIFSDSILRGCATMFRAMWPKIFYGLGLKLFPFKIFQFFNTILTDVFKARNYQPSTRNDFVDLLLSLKKKKSISGVGLMRYGSTEQVEMEVTEDFLVSHCFLLFAAGFETSAGALSLCLFELAKSQEAQRKAQREVDDVLKKHENRLEYDYVNELPFLDACVSETLRLHPPIAILTRQVIEDYTFPSGLEVEKGLRVHIPIYHIHHHPDHFPNPEEFRPERFLPDAEPIKPYTYFPFSEGPRACIGQRFSKMQVLAGLVTFLKKFHVTLAEGTPDTFRHRTTTIGLQPAIELRVKVALRDGWEERVYMR